jgi:hypothetical protein
VNATTGPYTLQNAQSVAAATGGTVNTKNVTNTPSPAKTTVTPKVTSPIVSTPTATPVNTSSSTPAM